MSTATDLADLLRQALAAADPAVRLGAVTQLRRELDALETEAVGDGLRAGMSWREIGMALGVSKQAAHRRHAKDVDLEPAADANAATASGAEALATAAVRHAVRIARREALAAGCLELGTEHLLLGLLQCGDEATTALLRRLGVTVAAARGMAAPTVAIPLEDAARALDATRREGDEGDSAAGRVSDAGIDGRAADAGITGRAVDAATAPRGPSATQMGLSPLTRRVVSHALRETVERGVRSLSALDLLDALLCHDHGGAAQTLLALGISPVEVRREILRVVRVSDLAPSAPPRPGAPAAAQA
ncbi:MAG TPA: Clp protease N-terminal domain-containing protein [Solirubrobacteraceae bacterium]|nr:Clp protease N-terminal domain-containing protein [Solirubrobacteraceae bacterium]